MRAYHQSQTIPTHTLVLSRCWCLHSVPSAVTHMLNVSGHVLIWTFFLVLLCGTLAQVLSTPFNYTLYMLYTFCFYVSCYLVCVLYHCTQLYGPVASVFVNYELAVAMGLL
jgi:hypothetical protein